MLKNYVKTAWRNLMKNKFYSFITITGLSIGLAVGILILIWVQDERSFDGFHRQADNLYKLENRVGTGSSVQIWTETTVPIGKMAAQELPEIQGSLKMTNNYFVTRYTYKDKTIVEENKYITDPALFTMFDFPLIRGNSKAPFVDDHSIVITESTAKRYFGNEDPMGKVLIGDDSINFTVTGLIHDFPKNSLFTGDIFSPMSLLANKAFVNDPDGHTIENDFVSFNFSTFLLIRPGTDLEALATKIRNIHLRMKADDTDVAYLFLPIKKAHLYHSDGTEAGIETVRMFTIIAIIILIIACINYVNLSTARSMLRSKEVSLRKIIGAARMQLFMQFIIETAILFLLATVLAIGMIVLLMPAFNSISGKSLTVDLLSYRFWSIIGVTILGTLIISSIYPALLLSSFEPLKALKGKVSTGINDAFFRKALVVTQFAFSIILITGTFIIGRQLKFMQSTQLGYNKDHVFSFQMREMSAHFDAVKADLLKQRAVTAVTKSGGSNIISIGNQTGDNDYDGKPAGGTMMIHPLGIDNDFIPFFQIGMLKGRNFDGNPADSAHVIVNETAVAAMGMKDPVGKRFRLWKTTATIIGVVKDFHFSSMKNKIEPSVFYYTRQPLDRIYIRTAGDGATAAIAAAETQWKKYNNDFPFSYSFLDESYRRLYDSEQRTGRLFNIFAGIAIFISCLGLLGLTAYTAQIRKREIGVRKVLGSSVTGIVTLLARDFIKLILVSLVIAVPVSWYAMNSWLQDFAYKIDIGWTVFALAGLLAIAIALVTISFQSIRAALANPIRSLRPE